MRKSATFKCCQCGEERFVVGALVKCPVDPRGESICTESPLTSTLALPRRTKKRRK
jgi:hypothetical protein